MLADSGAGSEATDIVTHLVSHGADLNAKDRNGKTAARHWHPKTAILTSRNCPWICLHLGVSCSFSLQPPETKTLSAPSNY
jgi:hypothetical protein